VTPYFSDVFVIPTYTFRRNQDFPDATGYAIKSGEKQRGEMQGEMLKSLLAILAILDTCRTFAVSVRTAESCQRTHGLNSQNSPQQKLLAFVNAWILMVKKVKPIVVTKTDERFVFSKN
jgi:hypothetical protein